MASCHKGAANVTTSHELPEELQKLKDKADVDKAIAEARSAQAKADKDAAEARREQLTALVPDLSKVTDSTMTIKDGPALQSAVLTYRALQEAAETVAAAVKSTAQNETRRILLTSDADLATADAVYHDVTVGIAQLEKAAETLLASTDAAFVADTMATLAAAVPATLSLLSAHRTVSTAAVTVSDLAAAAAVAGALTTDSTDVIHDTFRLVPTDSVFQKFKQLGKMRQLLVERKLKLEGQENAANEKVRLGLIDGVITAIDTFSAAIRTVATNAKRSPLASAALYEQLHCEQNKFSHVLLIKAEGGQAQQTTDNRPFWFKDKFSTFVDVNLLYFLIETPSSKIIKAGTVNATATTRGTIGENFIPGVESYPRNS